MTDNPTQRTYAILTQAYEHFNAALFGGQLPACLLTMQRRKGALGFFGAERFANPGFHRLKEPIPDVLDEIALNPTFFRGRPGTAILATLAREMVHVWQHHFGQPGRPDGYCNKQWAQQAKRIGLIPSDTGEPGGKETGMRLSCYIETGGSFEQACQAFLATCEVILYHDRERECETVPKMTLKTKYRCPNCGVNAWSKPGVSLRCDDCDRAMQVIVKKKTPALLDGSSDLRD